jgi:Tfp pilus assembly protein PilN
MATKAKINLLPQDQFEYSNTGKLIQWAVSVGRWIVVLTEFVVICAFLSRFYFDTVKANLFDETKQKQAIIESATSFEENFRILQEKIKLVRILLAEEKKPSGLIGEVSQLIPLNVSLTRIDIDEDNLKITGSAFSESGINVLAQGLINHQKLENVVLSDISINPESGPGIKFNLSAKIKKK